MWAAWTRLWTKWTGPRAHWSSLVTRRRYTPSAGSITAPVGPVHSSPRAATADTRRAVVTLSIYLRYARVRTAEKLAFHLFFLNGLFCSPAARPRTVLVRCDHRYNYTVQLVGRVQANLPSSGPVVLCHVPRFPSHRSSEGLCCQECDNWPHHLLQRPHLIAG